MMNSKQTIDSLFEIMEKRGGVHYAIGYLRNRLERYCDKCPGLLEAFQEDDAFLRKKEEGGVYP